MERQHSTSAYEHLLKILLIGDNGSGKRTLLQKYIGDEDMSDTTTLGEEMKTEQWSTSVCVRVHVCVCMYLCVCVCVCVCMCACACEIPARHGSCTTCQYRQLGIYIESITGLPSILLGLDYKLKDIVYKGKRIKLQLWYMLLQSQES